MILSEDNIRLDVNTIKECMEEIGDKRVNKKEFMDRVVADRLKVCNERYLEDYENEMKNVIRNINLGRLSLKDMLRYMKKVSRSTKSIYSTELFIYNSLFGGDENGR